MKNIIVVLALISILQSCNSESNSEKRQNNQEAILGNQQTAHKKSLIRTPVKINTAEIPDEIRYEGKLKNAVRWVDASGDNIVITAETGIYQSNKFEHEMDGGDAEIFAYHFIKSNGTFKRNWKVYDFISDCPVDIVASFIDKTFSITDLDQDGIAEIWLMYKTVCHGDVSPADMKVVMYEGQMKFAMKGESKVLIGVDDKGQKIYEGGKYTINEAFVNGPSVFLNFAKKLWVTNMIT